MRTKEEIKEQIAICVKVREQAREDKNKILEDSTQGIINNLEWVLKEVESDG